MSFFTPALLDGLSLESERQQVSRTYFSILADLSNVVAGMFSFFPLISTSSNLFSKPLGTLSREPTTIGNTIAFMFNYLFNSQARSNYLSISSLFFFVVYSNSKIHSTANSFFLLINNRSGLLNGSGWSVRISKLKWILWISFSSTN